MTMTTFTASLQGTLRFILNNHLLPHVLGKRSKEKTKKSNPASASSTSVLDSNLNLQHDASPFIQMQPDGQDLVSQLEKELTNHLRSNFIQPLLRSWKRRKKKIF
jgi:hypothetical protein